MLGFTCFCLSSTNKNKNVCYQVDYHSIGTEYKPLKWGICTRYNPTIILSKDIDKYAFMCGSNFYGLHTLLVIIQNIFLVCTYYLLR